MLPALGVLILLYFLLVNVTYLAMFTLSFYELVRHQLRARFATGREILQGRITPPVSILAPAYNEEKSIAESVRSLLKLEYGTFEVIVINDGSRDHTLQVMMDQFKLKRTARAYDALIPTREVRGIYRSEVAPNLLVVDKVNGGKADSLNAGINVSTWPLFCCIDADSMLERHALLRVAHPFMEAWGETVASGGLVRVANGCAIEDGLPTEVRTTDQWLVNFQIVEYLRAFLSGRMAFDRLNCLLIISGAFGLFKKQAVLEVGGYRTDVVGEDMELVVRLHHHMRKHKRPYRVRFVPDPVCWTEVPESLKVLTRQRNRWQRGLTESLLLHIGMLFNPRYGTVGLLAMPTFVVIEGLSPVVEVVGYGIFLLGLVQGSVQWQAFLTFFLLADVFGLILSVLALLMEEVAFRRYPRVRDLFRLLLATVLENFGYRQYMGLVRAKGLLDFARGQKSWGAMERKGFARKT